MHICVIQLSACDVTSAMSLGHRFWASRKGGTGGGGWVHLKGANSMVASAWA